MQSKFFERTLEDLQRMQLIFTTTLNKRRITQAKLDQHFQEKGLTVNTIGFKFKLEILKLKGLLQLEIIMKQYQIRN